MRVFSLLQTQEIKYGENHDDKVMLDATTLESQDIKLYCHYNDFYSGNIIGECFTCGDYVDEFHVGKIDDFYYKTMGIDGKTYKSFIYIFKCDNCYDDIFEGIVGDDIFDL